MTKRTVYNFKETFLGLSAQWGQQKKVLFKQKKDKQKLIPADFRPFGSDQLESKSKRYFCTITEHMKDLIDQLEKSCTLRFTTASLATIFGVSKFRVAKIRQQLRRQSTNSSETIKPNIVRLDCWKGFLISSLYSFAHMPLKARVQRLNLEHNTSFWTDHKLRKAYRQYGIKFKKVLVKRPFRRNITPEFQQKDQRIYDELLTQINMSLRYQQEIIFLDECVFSSKCYKQMAWSAKNSNIVQSQHLPTQPCLAVLGAISYRRGLVDWISRPKSIKTDDFIEFLHSLRKKTSKNRQLTVILDNCSVHKTQIARSTAVQLNLDLVFLVPYCPQMNAIELFWARVKKKFRDDTIRLMIGTRPQETFKETAARAMRSVSKETIQKCCQHSISEIMNWKPQCLSNT